ncbi:unnamed protein product [Adineta ricciae]|uniref:Beta-1,4-galactosyltransferase n=1 Tax=Adineta ricciae TaxID=249248 RepID=A0A814YYY9_ADIRI|nr:unnamed protein product [Adineta ricciae]
MIITSFLNIMYILRHPTTHVNGEHDKQKLSATAKPEDSPSTTKLMKIPNNQSVIFQAAFKKLLDSFNEKYISTMHQHNSTNLLCPSIPPDLQGPLIIKGLPKNFTLLKESSYHSEVQSGGRHQPKTCLPRHKVAIIVPYRNRWEILEQFLFHTHTFLQRQQLDYRIFVCEQAYDKTFNKGIVMNGCFKEILKLEPNTQCFIMHDVDLLLIDDRNMYSCPINPRHLSVAVDKFQFYLPYPELVGGVLAMRREHYLLVNGYSTNYWGWGGEDDDMHKRIVKKKLILDRPPTAIARYKMLKHSHQKLNPARMKVLRTANNRIDSDGVNNNSLYERRAHGSMQNQKGYTLVCGHFWQSIFLYSI